MTEAFALDLRDIGSIRRAFAISEADKIMLTTVLVIERSGKGEMVNVVGPTFIASPAADMVTGTLLFVDGDWIVL